MKDNFTNKNLLIMQRHSQQSSLRTLATRNYLVALGGASSQVTAWSGKKGKAAGLIHELTAPT